MDWMVSYFSYFAERNDCFNMFDRSDIELWICPFHLELNDRLDGQGMCVDRNLAVLTVNSRSLLHYQ